MSHASGTSLIGRLNRSLRPVEDLLNLFAAWTVFAVMVFTTFQVFTRLAGHPVPGYLEASEQAIAIFAFLGVAYAQRLDAHIRMDMLIGAVRGRMRWIAEAAGTAISMIVIALLIRYSFSFFYDAWTIGDSSYDYGIPTWPSKLLVPIAFSIWFLRLSIEFLGYLRLVLWPDAPPVAVPVIRSASEVSKEEVQSAFGDET